MRKTVKCMRINLIRNYFEKKADISKKKDDILNLY